MGGLFSSDYANKYQNPNWTPSLPHWTTKDLFQQRGDTVSKVSTNRPDLLSYVGFRQGTCVAGYRCGTLIKRKANFPHI